MEHLILLDNVDPITLFGTNNSNVELLKVLFPKLRIVARGNLLKLNGEAQQIKLFQKSINLLSKHCNQYNQLDEDNIRDIIDGKLKPETVPGHTILFGVNGKPIQARTSNQKKLLESYHKNDLLFAIGPAGSGKTYTAIALAVKALKNKEVKRIILSRPAVEAGESLGFLPGDLKEKIDPYLQPLYDALKDMIPAARLNEFVEKEVIQIAPLAYMRGRTLNDAVVILDEAQNTTTNQLKMFLTRMGKNAKFIITGDVTQIDLPSNQVSGLVQALKILNDIEGISKITFTINDIVRHALVKKIVEAYKKV